MELITSYGNGTLSKQLVPVPGSEPFSNAWQESVSVGEDYNEPGRFTALLCYERTSDTGANNLHRNVIFRDNGDKVA